MDGATEVQQVSRQEYERRVERVLAYIREHLDGDLSLHTLPRVANFSPYHFHRVFRAMVGEPVGTFVRRLRVLTAAQRLAEDRGRPITTIARECGFSSSSAFAREFRNHFGITASAYRRLDPAGKKRQLARKIREDTVLSPPTLPTCPPSEEVGCGNDGADQGASGAARGVRPPRGTLQHDREGIRQAHGVGRAAEAPAVSGDTGPRRVPQRPRSSGPERAAVRRVHHRATKAHRPRLERRRW